MIIRRFLQWVATAPAEARAEGTAALARAYLDRELDPAERPDAETALIAMLDDPAPVVRLALALEVASSPHTPPALVTALLADRSDIAALPLEFSPVPGVAELVDAVALGDSRAQCAVARRAGLDVGVAAALAEVAGAEPCAELCRNESATVPESALFRMVERFGDDAAVRGAVAARAGVAPALRYDLVVGTARSLMAFVSDRGWLAPDRAARTAAEATEQACVIIAAGAQRDGDGRGVAALVRHLRERGCLTPALMLRALLCGNRALFEAALSDLADVPQGRVAGLLRAGQGLAFRSLYEKAGLPAELCHAFAAALGSVGEGEGTVPQRGPIARVLAACGRGPAAHLGTVTALLRRLDAQAAREEARSYARDVLREPTPLRLPRLSPSDRGMPMPSAA